MKMDQEKPKPPGLAALFVLSAILGALAGAVYSASTRKPAEPDESANDPTPRRTPPNPNRDAAAPPAGPPGKGARASRVCVVVATAGRRERPDASPTQRHGRGNPPRERRAG